MLLPYITPVVAATFVWTVALDPQAGIVNAWGTRFLGWDEAIPFLSTQHGHLLGIPVPTALLVVIAFETWRYFPFAFLFLLARLQAVPVELEEAARVDGATISQRFRYILLPQLGPVIALLSVLRFIMTFTKFDDVFLLTGGGSGIGAGLVEAFAAQGAEVHFLDVLESESEALSASLAGAKVPPRFHAVDLKDAQAIAALTTDHAAIAKARMLATRSAMPVSTVIAFSIGPTTAMQAWPAASP